MTAITRDQLRPEPVNRASLGNPLRNSFARKYAHSSWVVLSLGMLVCGCFLLSWVNVSYGPFIVALPLLGIGLGAHLAFGRAAYFERRAFLLSFGACVLVAGLSQLYANTVFGRLQNAPDAGTFYELSVDGISGESMSELELKVNAPLAVVVYQAAYSLAALMRLDDGPWVGVLLNCFLVAGSASMTVLCGRCIYGNDPRRLRLIGTLFAACGLFWLMGAIFIRDCFALFLNVTMMWAYLRALRRPTAAKLLVLVLVTIVATGCMRFIREYSLYVVILFSGIAVFSWSQRQRGGLLISAAVAIFTACALLTVSSLSKIFATVAEVSTERRDAYTQLTESEIEGTSLGYTLVTGQILPIRVISGVIYLHIFPIPLWNGFSLTADEYQWIKSFQGIYMVLVVPLVALGLIRAYQRTRRHGVEAPQLCFIALYAVTSAAVVAATSLETRHHGQFLPSYLLLAALPDMTDLKNRALLNSIRITWFIAVAAGHGLWWLLKR